MPLRLSSSAIRAVLFDVDGTLVDSLGMIVRGLSDTVETFIGSRPSDQELLSLIGLPLRHQMKLFGGRDDQIETMSAHAVAQMEVYSDRETIFNDSVAALRLIHEKGIKTALVTSKSREELEPFLNRFQGTDYVDAIVCASDVKEPKPAAESAILACQKLAVHPQQAVLVGDSIYDIRCARAAGLACVGVAYGAAPREVLLAEEPDLLLDTPRALLDWVESTFCNPSCP